jgi:dTDP-4-amino-4,6-dideoxygalactose transaminase
VRYIHHEIGYNFRLTNIQAALGVAQLEQLSGFLKRKKEINQQYVKAVEQIKGLVMAAVPNYADNNQWMNLLQINSKTYGEDREVLMKRLEGNSIQTRPVWGLNHLQKPYRDCQNYKIEKTDELVAKSLCLPSSTNLQNEDLKNIVGMLS